MVRRIVQQQRSLWLGIALLVIAVAMVPVSTLAQSAGQEQTSGTVVSPHAPKNALEAATQEKAIAEYWTPERMQSAKPYPLPKVYAGPEKMTAGALSVPPGPPGIQPGYNPNDPNSKPFSEPIIFDADVAPLDLDAAATALDDAASLSASYPSAHTTYQFQGRYLTYPRSTVGKLFFSQAGGNWVCSASLIGYKYVVTAGHCVNSGPDSGSVWSTNVMFCPSYDSSQGGVNPVTGCWTTNTLTTTTRWRYYGEPDADLGMAVYSNNGTLHSSYPGDVCGHLAYAWNFGVGQHEEMFGYPSADRPNSSHNDYANFDGGKIFVTSAEEAGYTINWGTYADSKFIGTTQTPGCSGGPWIFRYGMKYYYTWNSNAVNGVNSSGRCWDYPTCNDLYVEVSSPQFIKYTSDGNCTLPNCGVVDTIVWTMNNY